MSFAPGTRLDRYAVVGVLGQGGMAVVYKVRHVQLGTFHALKVLNTPSPHIRERMLREGRVQGSLRHPNLVPVTDLVQIDGSPGLIMEFVDGPTLEALLERYRPTLEQADALAIGILEGVAYAHRKGLVHRDLKPANVLLSNSATGLVPKVSDFGLAKLVHGDEPEGLHTTRSGVVMGTPSYMSPEQIRDSKHVDQRADVFSLGVMLYELVTGTKPFVGEDIVKLYTAITNGAYRPLQELVPNIPERMERAIVGALVVDRHARIQDCDRLLAIWKGDTSSRRASTDAERAAARAGDPPETAHPFFPEASQEGGAARAGGAPTTRDHWLLADLSKVRIAAPDIGAIDPTSDVPVEPRVVIPVAPDLALPSIDVTDLGASRAEARGSWSGVAAGIGLLVLLGIAAAVAWSQRDPAPPAPVAPTPAVEAPPSPAAAPKVPSEGSGGRTKNRVRPPSERSPARPSAPGPTAGDGSPLAVEDVGVSPGAAPAVDPKESGAEPAASPNDPTDHVDTPAGGR